MKVEAGKHFMSGETHDPAGIMEHFGRRLIGLSTCSVPPQANDVFIPTLEDGILETNHTELYVT